ncbi:50S ribosomal protein L25 [Candidatus Woesebacteria bacterium]|nr:MAG: 50S ribosomal protein L25 [Candidatus Woesebacteria bacterium]
MTKQILKAQNREIVGRKVKKLRREGILPANVFGKKVKSLSIQIATKEFADVYKKVGETGLIELEVGSTKKPVLVHDVQVDPVTGELLHADFFQVNLTEKVTAHVPVELVGESPADKSGLGTLVQHVDEVEVEALPADLPDKFEVDVSKLTEVESSVSIADLRTDKKVEILADDDLIIAKVEALREEEPEVVVEAVEGEVKEAVDDKAKGETVTESSEEKK